MWGNASTDPQKGEHRGSPLHKIVLSYALLHNYLVN